MARIQALEKALSTLEAKQLRAVAELASSAESRRGVPQELAMGLSMTAHAAERKVALAETLDTRLPQTLAAMEAGTLNAYKASKVADETACLSDEHALRADEKLASRLQGKDPTQLRRAVNRVVAQVDPDGYARRVARRREERSLQLVHQDEGMATLIADLPVEVATSIYARVDREARRRRRGGDPKNLDQLRADVFAEVCLQDGTGTGSVRAEVFVYVAATTLLGLDNEPAEMAGHGYIPAWLAREIATRPDSVWRRILTDPMTGHPIDLGRTTYRPPAALDEFVRIRDRECRAPGCYRPSQVSELDHSIDWHKLGTTTEKRLIGFCKVHHGIKDHPGWSYTVNDTDGTFTITTPTGQRHTNRPRPLHDSRKPCDPRKPREPEPPSRAM